MALPTMTASIPAAAPPPRASRLLARAPSTLLHRGRWANPAVHLVTDPDGRQWVLKTYRDSPWWFRHTIGRWLTAREARSLARLAGLPGIPGACSRLSGHGLLMSYVPGRSLRELGRQPAPALGKGFFLALEELVRRMHERGVAHLDLRHAGNVLVGEDGSPVLLDFQSSAQLRWKPRAVQGLMRMIDHSGVLKWWSRLSPDTLDEERRALLARHARLRRFWWFRGYRLLHRWRPVPPLGTVRSLGKGGAVGR